MIFISGEGTIEASDGEIRTVRPGMILLVEDTTGRDHVSRVTGPEGAFVVVVTLPD